MTNIQQKTYEVRVNPSKYHHPHYNPITSKSKPTQNTKFNLRKHFHKICFSIGIASFLVPLLTNPILKEDDPDIQRNIKIACYSTMILSSLIGYANEKSVKTLETRRYQDIDVNAEYRLNRHVLELKFSRDYQEKTIESDLMTLQQAESAGAYGLPYYPQSLANIAMSRFAPPQEPQNSLNGNMGNLDSSVYHLPQVSNTEAIDSINDAYDYVSDKSKRNYRGLLIYGDTGDNKTTMLHWVMNRWLQREPDSVFYVCDRKFFSEDDPMWRSNWCGLPVYTDVKHITKPGVPHPSVYAKFQPDLEEWLAPVYTLLENRTGEQKATSTPEQKLINPSTGKVRPVVILIDDATMIISGYSKDKQTRVNRIIDELTTLGRSADISVFFISHSNTASVTGLSTTTLTMLAPVVGSSFVGDTNILQFSKRPICPEGIQKCMENQTGKKRYFATAWVDAPFLPPAPYDPNTTGMLGAMIPELTKVWHQTCPDGFLVQEYHTKAIQSLGINSIQELRHGTKPTTNTTSKENPPETQSAISERAAIAQLRGWAKENLKDEVNSHNELIAKFSEISGTPIKELENYGEQLSAVVTMSDDEFSKI